MMSEPEKLSGASLDVAAAKRAELKQLFPAAFTETVKDNGELVASVDFERLKAEMGQFTDLFERRRERYGMEWPGKADCLKVIQEQSRATLKPSRKESVNFDSTENLFIEGDNLEVLKLLQKSYHGQVKMIYIDPPYNTGKEFIYPDRYAESLDTYLDYAGLTDEKGRRIESKSNTKDEGRYHTKWMNMMYPRLYLARNLLRDDGVIFTSIDENEVSNLRKICDEIFGEINYCGEIIWKNSSKNDQDYISIQHEYMLAYVKSKAVNKGEWLEKKEGLEQIYAAFDSFRKEHGNDWAAIHQEALKWYKQFPESNPIYSSKHYSWMDERGVYFPDNISGPNDGQYVYEVIHPVTNKPCKQPSTGWRYPENTMKERIADNLVHFGVDDSTVPNNKTYLKNTEFQSLTSMRFVDGRSASKRLATLFGVKLFTNPKDEFLLKDLFKAAGVKGNDIVLDFFAGSGTTQHEVVELNAEQESQCSAILVQLPEDLNEMAKSANGSSKKAILNAIEYLKDKGLQENISEIGKERSRLVIKQKNAEQAEKAKASEGELDLAGGKEALKPQDLGFRVLKLDKSNFKAWQPLPADASEEEIKKALQGHLFHVDETATQEEILFEILLKAGFMPSTEIETLKLAGKTVYSVAEGMLFICLEDEITRELIDAVVEKLPQQFICLDLGFKGNDQLKANTVQTFNALNESKDKDTKIIFRTV